MTELDEFELWNDRGDDKPLIIRGEARLPRDAKSAVVICHGFKGFARWAFFPYLADQIAAAGIRAVTFDFSGSGVGEDRENFTNRDAFTRNTFTRELEDLDAVVSEARVRDWIEDGYGLFGHSRGGGVAVLHAARNQDVKALVTWAAISHTNRWSPADIADWRARGYADVHNARTGETIPLSTDILDEIEKLGETTLNVEAAAAGIRAPWLIVHGANDETVPPGEGERLHELSTGVSTLRLVEGANHAFDARHPLTAAPPVLDAATRETVEFFTRYLTRQRM